jgi:nicotinamidase-related amidase
MAATPQRALIVIDLQNDYFPDGKFPLWNTEAVLAQVESAIARARAQGVPVILVQHIADAPTGGAVFRRNERCRTAPRILAAAPDAVVVTKAQADGFLNTTLEEKLAELGVEELLICGMMTQNCVTHTAISSGGEVPGAVLGDCCTSVSQMIH